ncbi:GNAT family N-acetyltransferase [Pleionea sp. CnH1-48]|uniref:GNAT family N-acetyltransferase n=1 Tax=Pleionea sp. CnH1-48 TaxID=2954494 RepID=UPI00209740B1|nr:GNAT family N-acetyltransferase [Pleionea sp. CnH1-48]MCO7226131.1 GNAT family N-acetyltransferase [Pleionea sp. CnH1-48]
MYQGHQYAQTLAHIGQPVALPNASTYVIERAIDSSHFVDWSAPYPLLCCRNWSAMVADVNDAPEDLVSFVAVVDPLKQPSDKEAQQIFNHSFIPFKRHYVIDFEQPMVLARHHRRNVSKAQKNITVELHAVGSDLPEAVSTAWLELYRQLKLRHSIVGVADFSDGALKQQLLLCDVFVARVQKHIVGMLLFTKIDERIYYHLGAHADQGYKENSSYALFSAAIDYYQKQSIQFLDLGGSSGVKENANDGLGRFKKGWCNAERIAYLGGRIHNLTHYHQLSSSPSTSYFPAYRA